MVAGGGITTLRLATERWTLFLQRTQMDYYNRGRSSSFARSLTERKWRGGQAGAASEGAAGRTVQSLGTPSLSEQKSIYLVSRIVLTVLHT
jgi:hypothetical protein